ncbi:type VII secretion integral membrane protein EccD [Mycolicibacterium rhodesiae]|nr:type VII secretion integral membrane protein EccD [Mycolicibacterium rhodesiae]
MSDSICRLTVAGCTDDAHCAVDLVLPAGIHVNQLLPQIVDILHGDTAQSVQGRDWRLSRLGGIAMDDSMTLSDNGVRDGEVLLLTTIEPPPAEWADCDPCHVLLAEATPTGAAVERTLSTICCVLLGGCGAVALALPGAGVANAGRIATGACIALAAAVGAAVVRRRRGDPLLCVPLSLTAVLYAGAVGYVAVPPGPVSSSLLLAASAVFAAAILLLRATGCGRTCLMAVGTLSALVSAVAAAGALWGLELTVGGAVLALLSLAVIGLAPRIAMVLSGTGPSTPGNDAALCHRTLTGLVMGASIASFLGTATVAAGSALSDITFAAVLALVLLLRARTHVDSQRRVSLASAGVLTAVTGLIAVALAAPAQAHVVSVLAATAGAAVVSCSMRPTVTPMVVRTVEVVEYLALAAVVPLACWVGGIYGLARGMSLI